MDIEAKQARLKALNAQDLFKENFKYKPMSLNSFFPLSPLEDFEAYVFDELKDDEVAFGGYLERRTVYQQSEIFLDKNRKARSIHLGTDFWQKAGTEIFAPLAGVLLGKYYNAGVGNYGGTVIIKHQFEDFSFYTLYGHIDVESVTQQAGEQIRKGDLVAQLGGPKVNGGWPPHLHFQVITELDERKIDFPGVCLPEEKEHFQKICLNPNWLLGYE